MPSLKDLKTRIASVKSTRKITKAMQMVASAKMRRAQQAALAGRPYATLMNEVLAAAKPRFAVTLWYFHGEEVAAAVVLRDGRVVSDHELKEFAAARVAR